MQSTGVAGEGEGFRARGSDSEPGALNIQQEDFERLFMNMIRTCPNPRAQGNPGVVLADEDEGCWAHDLEERRRKAAVSRAVRGIVDTIVAQHESAE